MVKVSANGMDVQMHGFPASLPLSARIRPDKNVDPSIKWKAELDSYWYFAELWQSGISLPVYCNSVNREFPKNKKMECCRHYKFMYDKYMASQATTYNCFRHSKVTSRSQVLPSA